MPSIADVYVTVLPETGQIASGMERAFRLVDPKAREAGKRWGREIERGIGDIRVNLVADTTRARREIDDLTRDQRATIDVDADTARAEAEIDRVARDRRTTIRVDADRTAIDSVTGSIEKLGSAFGKIGSLAAGPVKLEGIIGALSIAPNVVPILGQAVSAVGQLSGLLGLLPAAAGTAGLAMASLKIATAGFGDAIKAIGDPKKFADAISQLAPSARGAALAIQGLMPEISSLKATVQNAFFQGFGEQITALGTTYLPMFRTVMSQMAASANTALTGISKMLQTPEMQSDLKTMTSNMAVAWDTVTKALQPVVKAFSDIAFVGSGFLPGLANTVKDLADRFGNFIDRARDTGKLAEWIQGGIDAFTDLKDIVVNTWNIIGGVFRAAAGPQGAGGLLQTVSDLTEKWSNWVNSDVGQNKIGEFFRIAREEWDKWWPILQDLPGIFWTAFQKAKEAMEPVRVALGLVTELLKEHPGLIQVVVDAFLAWKTISGIATLVSSLKDISTLLRLTLPADAAVGAAGIRGAFAALGTIAVPVTLAIVAEQLNNQIDSFLQEHWPWLYRLNHTGTPDQWGPAIRNWISGGDSSPGGGGGSWGNDSNGNPLPQPGPGQASSLPGAQVARRGDTTPTPPPNAANNLPSPPVIPGPSPVPGDTGPGSRGSSTGSHTIAPSGFDWDAVAAAEASGNWSNADTGHNGHYGGLQFSPETWKAFGGEEFASRADYATADEQKTVADRTAFYGYMGTPPQGLGAWEAITTGKVAGITTRTVPPRPSPQYGSALTPRSSSSSSSSTISAAANAGGVPQPPAGGFPGGANVTYTAETMQALGIPALFTNPAGGGNPQIPKWVQDFVKLHGGPSLVAASNPHPGLHGASGGPGWAIDISGSGPNADAEMDRLAQYLVDNPSESAQLIHRSKSGTSFGVAGGVNVSGSYYGESDQGYPGHVGHVHWVPSSGGKGLTTRGVSTDAQGNVTVTPSSDTDGEKANEKGQTLGESFVDGLFAAFGFDGTVFKDPRQFGIVKLGTALLNYFNGIGESIANPEGTPHQGSGASPGPGNDGNGGGLGAALSAFVPQPFGAPNVAGQHEGSGAAPGPGGINNSITIANNNFRDADAVIDQVYGAQLSQIREPARNLPGPPR